MSPLRITRSTWASPAYGVKWPVGNYTLKTALIFVLGTADTEMNKQVQEEAMLYKDILQGTKFLSFSSKLYTYILHNL